uniref:Uncharacterized protein n=1 Tax=Sphaerodactylus townsendi TaxID=933632 RepID=A0ACB8E6I2_9SAUR
MTAEEAEAGVDITPKRDGGVLKIVKKGGVGTESPMIGDKVMVHYTGWLLDGTQFDSSRDRKDKFSFDFGKGEVIKAWDIAVGTMTVGELSRITCKPEYAYGSAGSPPKIPPNATLVFEIELFDFKGKDLTEDEDGGIIQRIQKKGEGYSKPNEGALVEKAPFVPRDAEIEGRHGDRAFDKRELHLKWEKEKSTTFPWPGQSSPAEHGEISEECVVYLSKPRVPRLKKVGQFLAEGFVFESDQEQGNPDLSQPFPVTHSYGFGSTGKEKFQIPPDADLQYAVRLKSFEKAKESWEMNTDEKLEQGFMAKERGTQHFKEGKYKRATLQYKKIVSWLEHESGLSGAEEQKARSLRLAAHLNLAMCHLKLKEYSLALENCNKALELDGSNEKGLFRRGEAQLAVNDFELARADFQKQKIREQHEREKKMYANMFQRLADKETKLGPGYSLVKKTSA